MRIRYDAKEIAESIENMSCEFGRYRTNADILEEQYEKYCRNDTYIGLAAKASKKFIGEGQMKLHYENLEIQKMVLDRYMAIEDDFKSMVDSSPEARIDTDALEENSDHYEKQLEYLDRIGRRVEDRSDYVIEEFGKYNSDITRASYSGTRMSYDEECEYIAKCIKTVKEFDELSLCAVQNSGMAECISDLQDDITRTTMALGQMKAYEPKMDKVELNLLPQGGAPKAMTTLSMSGSTNNVQLMQLNSLLSGTAAMGISLNDILASEEVFNPAMEGIVEQCIQQFFVEAGCLVGEIKEAITVALPEMIASSLADGTLPVGEVIALGILLVTLYLVHQENQKTHGDEENNVDESQEVDGKEKVDSKTSDSTGGNSGDDDGYNGYEKKINKGQQNKHIKGTNENNVAEQNGQHKSTLDGDINDAQDLLDEYSGKGDPINSNKERVDFGKKIGEYYDPETGEYIDTTKGIIHYGNDGAHIVPARP